MSRKNGKEPTTVEANRKEIMSSGVEITILPFPARLHDSIQNKALEKFPEPIPPKKIIKVVDGVEEVEDLSNPDYIEARRVARIQREGWVGQRIGENVIDLCLIVDPQPYLKVIERLAKSLDEEVPSDSDELKEFFLMNYALRGRADYERITSVSLTLMAVGDKEITERMESFRNEMARTANNKVEAPSPDEAVRVDME